MSGDGSRHVERSGKLSIPLPFEDALRAVLKVKPKPDPEKPAQRKRPQRTAKKPA
jgi:hypothetical protein